MLNQFQKWIYNICALSPIVLVFGVTWFIKCKTWRIPLISGVVFILLTIYYLWLHNHAVKKLETIKINVVNVGNSDKKVFLYMFTYILPATQFAFKERDKIYLIVCGVIAIIGMVILFRLNTILINPIWVFKGYNLYDITTDNGVRYDLICNKSVRNKKDIKQVKRITEYYVVNIGE